MHTFPSHAVSHICLTAKTNKGTGSQTLAPVVLLSGTFASRGHRGILHRVNKPICTNCCKNSQTQSLLWPVKARSVPIDVGVSVSNTWRRPRSSNFQRSPPKTIWTMHLQGSLKTVTSVAAYGFWDRLVGLCGTETVRIATGQIGACCEDL